MRIPVQAAAVIALSLVALPAKSATYSSEEAARSCVQKRLGELIVQSHRGDIAADPNLIACTKDLKDELQAKGKNDCEATDYVGWVVTNENSKLNGLSGGEYKPNKGFIQRCSSAGKKAKGSQDKH